MNEQSNMEDLRLRFTKTGRAVYISHLDLMRTVQRSFVRAGLRLKHSEGFNPHPQLVFALPLSVGMASECELLDFKLDELACVSEIPYLLNRALPDSHLPAYVQASAAASKVIDDKAAGYNVIGDPRPVVTAYVAQRQISEGTYPALAALVTDVANQVQTYGSIAKIPSAADASSPCSTYPLLTIVSVRVAASSGLRITAPQRPPAMWWIARIAIEPTATPSQSR